MRHSEDRTWIRVVIAALGLPFLLVCWALIMRSGELVYLTPHYRYFTSPDGVILEYDITGCKPELVDRIERGWRPVRVGPGVDSYRVYRRVIVGHVAKTWEGDKQPAYIKPESGCIPGYFIIDLRHDTLHRGLGKQEWLQKLRGYGIKQEPELFKPSICDKLLGRNKPCDE